MDGRSGINLENEYWASLKGEALGEAIFEKKSEYQRFVQDAGLLNLWRAMHYRYYGQDPRTSVTDRQIQFTGQKGEIHNLNVNHLRADVSLWLSLASAQRNEYQPETTQDSYEGEIEAKYASTLLEHWRNRTKLEEVELQSLEYAGIYGVGYRLLLWDEMGGELVVPPMEAGVEGAEMDPSASQAVMAGALEAHALHPLDVFLNPFQTKPRNEWMIARVWKNKWDIIARHGEFKDKILSIRRDESDLDTEILRTFGTFSTIRNGFPSQDKESLPVYYAIHEPTPAVPDGLIAKLCSPETVFWIRPLRPTYKRSPLKRLACSEWGESPFGYSPAMGLLAPQEAIQSLGTIGLTNARTFGLGVLIAPKGSDIEDTAITDGLTLVEYPAGLQPPTSLQMPTTPQEVYVLRDALINEAAQMLGLNSVVRGDPEASLKSGSALALVQATATQAVQQFAQSIIRCNEDTALDVIHISAANMDVPQQLEAAGPELAPLINFTGSMVRNVARVKALMVNPLAKNLAGRVQIADTILEKYPGQIEIGDYFRLLETGNLDQILRPKAKRMRNLDRENEMLAAGRSPIAFLTDDHRAHVRKHLEVLDNPLLRESQDPRAIAIVQAVDAHVDHHVQLAIEGMGNLPLLELAGILPLESMMAMAAPPPSAENAPPGEEPPTNAPSTAEPIQPVPPEALNQPRMPEMPVNPATGERAPEPPGPP